ncbi:MAG: putative bifunctional diguanylate cyclase/phosphodiesterase [Gammaproteobacteria bacterium]
MVSPNGNLRDDQHRLERVLEASGLGLWELDVDTGDFHVDGRCARNLGYAEGQLQASWDTGMAIIHPDDAVRVSRRFEAHLRGETDTLEYETRMLTHGRAWTWVAGHGRLVRGADGRPTHISGTLKNIDAERNDRRRLLLAERERRRLARRLRHQAQHDPLTGLLNRRGFESRLAALLHGARHGGHVHALCYLDLDHFKLVNDTCGHAAGDELLRQLPRLLAACLRPGDAIARLGGDEFALLLAHCTLEAAAGIAAGVQAALREYRFEWQFRRFAIGASIGVTGVTAASAGAASVLRAADAACYVAKDEGRGGVHVSYPHDLAIVRRRGQMRWVARLKHALEEDRFALHYMSIAPVAGGPARHHELLLRLAGEDGELVMPGAFLPAAERYQLMPLIDHWVIAHAARGLGQALARDSGLCQHRFGINLSADSLRDPQLLAFVRGALVRHGVPPAMVYFELTESAAIANLGAAAGFMRGLRELGCAFALDDFGSGMSSFTWLKQLPVDLLKIDGGFIREIVHNPVDQAIVRAVLAVGAQLGIPLIAEYVETAAIRAALRELGVHYGQGHAIARPAPLEHLSKVSDTFEMTA